MTTEQQITRHPHAHIPPVYANRFYISATDSVVRITVAEQQFGKVEAGATPLGEYPRGAVILSRGDAEALAKAIAEALYPLQSAAATA